MRLSVGKKRGTPSAVDCIAGTADLSSQSFVLRLLSTSSESPRRAKSQGERIISPSLKKVYVDFLV